MASQSSVANFLFEFKELIDSRRYYFIPRPQNNTTIREFGLTGHQVRLILLSLSVRSYCKGPEADKDREGELWFFGANIESSEVYIKLKIAEAGGEKFAKCLSFHIAKYPLRYPLR